MQQAPVAWVGLLREARDNCKASIAEEGISASRKEYRIDLEGRLTAALNTAPPQRKPLTDEEPFGYFRPEPFGWTDCAETDEGAVALYEQPPKRKPLTEEEIEALDLPTSGTATVRDLVRLIERAHDIGEKE
jgi:hypothetical protein